MFSLFSQIGQLRKLPLMLLQMVKLVMGLILFSAPLSYAQTATQPVSSSLHYATFAGGCFWCMEPPFDALEGVVETVSGYSGGTVDSPTYQAVSAGTTGHTEVVRIAYDPTKVSYEKLLEVFWKNIDPTVENRQFCDTGSQYRSAIFYHNDEQKFQALASFEKIKKQLIGSGKAKQVYTEISEFDRFYPAEGYHQDYYIRNPVRYKYYRYRCGRDKRLQEIWGNQLKSTK